MVGAANLESLDFDKESSACVLLIPDCIPCRLKILSRKAIPTKGPMPMSAMASPNTLSGMWTLSECGDV